jgi:transcriptional regulatory protein LevR
MIMARVQLMYESNQMDRETLEQIPGILQKIEEFLHIRLGEENAGGCVSHLIKAIQRIKTGQAIQECSDELMNQVKEVQPLFDFSKEILSPYNANQSNINAEAAFVTSYFAMMIEEN